MRIGAVVEGLGDRKAFPSIISKTAQLFDCQAYVVHSIECGGWSNLKKEGGLERFGRLMKVSANVDRIIFCTDLDDGCPVEEVLNISERRCSLEQMLGVPVHICLLNREFETWFLQKLDSLRLSSPEIEWVEGYEIANPESVRDAKGAFDRAMRYSYRPSIDQERFAKRLPLDELIGESRSLRKIASILTGRPQEDFIVQA